MRTSHHRVQERISPQLSRDLRKPRTRRMPLSNRRPPHASTPPYAVYLASLLLWEIARFRRATLRTHELAPSTSVLASVRRLGVTGVFVIVCVSGSSSAQGYERWSAWVSLTLRMPSQRRSGLVPFESRHDSEIPRHRYHLRLVWVSLLYLFLLRYDGYLHRCTLLTNKAK